MEFRSSMEFREFRLTSYSEKTYFNNYPYTETRYNMAAAVEGSNRFKVVLLGEGCVGKTSLVLRYCSNTFNDKHVTTMQVFALCYMLFVCLCMCLYHLRCKLNLCWWSQYDYMIS